MPPRNELLQKRYARIKKKFEKMSTVVELREVRRHTYAEIIAKLSKEFCYSPKTIENICTGQRGR